MKSAQDYPINFPYGATDYPYGKPELPFHRGDDRATPNGTKLIIQNKLCALTGESGFVTGPHLHIQEWKGTVYDTRKPQNAFKPGLVTTISNNVNQQWGRYITISNEDGWNTTYCHLSEIYVSKGDIIKEEDTMTPSALNALSQAAWNKPADDKFIKSYTGKDVEKTIVDVLNSSANKELRTKANNFDNVQRALNEAYKRLNSKTNPGDAEKALAEIRKIVNNSK